MNPTRFRSLLAKWYPRIRTTHKGHYRDAALLGQRQQRLGIAVVVLSAIVGTSLFYSLVNASSSPIATLITGLISALAATLATLQTYLNYPAKQTTHIIAATQLSSLKKRIEEKLVVEDDAEELKSFIREIRAEWDAITHGAPLLSEDTYDDVAKANLKPEYFELEVSSSDGE